MCQGKPLGTKTSCKREKDKFLEKIGGEKKTFYSDWMEKEEFSSGEVSSVWVGGEVYSVCGWAGKFPVCGWVCVRKFPVCGWM